MAAGHGVVQTVLTGTIKPNAVEKLRAFGLEQFFDLEIGGYGSQVYPKGAQLMMTRSRAADKYGTRFDEDSTVYIADSTRDVTAAQTGGARCLAVASGRSTRERAAEGRGRRGLRRSGGHRRGRARDRPADAGRRRMSGSAWR